MHNDVKQCFCGSTCIVVVVVTHESNVASYLPEVRNLNGRNADMSCDVAGPSSSHSRDLFVLSGRSNATHFYYFPHY